jgi:hypothetical protein
MFATLVVVLPSTSTGGELLVRHKDREVRLDLHGPDPSEVAFAAFYADCVHEVLPITSGFRLALIYNLLRPGPGRRPEPPSYASQQAQLAALLQAWGVDLGRSITDAPEKLIVPLEHAYTSAELGFGALKGADAAAAAVLKAAGPGRRLRSPSGADFGPGERQCGVHGIQFLVPPLVGTGGRRIRGTRDLRPLHCSVDMAAARWSALGAG